VGEAPAVYGRLLRRAVRAGIPTDSGGRYLRTDNIVVILVVIAILALVFDQIVRRINTRVTRWKPRI